MITKPARVGGRVDVDTVRHQLLYEVHDPAAYFSPDVVADFTSRDVHDLGDDRVRVTGVRGRPGDRHLQGAARLPRRAGPARRGSRSRGPTRREKAKATAAIFGQAGGDGRPSRCASGASSTGASTRSAGPTVPRDRRREPPEVRAAGRVALRRRAHRRARRPRARPAHAVGAARRADRHGPRAWRAGDASCSASGRRSSTRSSSTRTSPSRWRRSDGCGWRCASCAGTEPATRATSPTSRSSPTTTRPTTLIVARGHRRRVKEHFGAMVHGEVVRYEAPNVRALNFVLRGALGGGGPRSLRSRQPRQDARRRARAPRDRRARRARRPPASPPRRHLGRRDPRRAPPTPTARQPDRDRAAAAGDVERIDADPMRTRAGRGACNAKPCAGAATRDGRSRRRGASWVSGMTGPVAVDPHHHERRAGRCRDRAPTPSTRTARRRRGHGVEPRPTGKRERVVDAEPGRGPLPLARRRPRARRAALQRDRLLLHHRGRRTRAAGHSAWVKPSQWPVSWFTTMCR